MRTTSYSFYTPTAGILHNASRACGVPSTRGVRRCSNNGSSSCRGGSVAVQAACVRTGRYNHNDYSASTCDCGTNFSDTARRSTIRRCSFPNANTSAPPPMRRIARRTMPTPERSVTVSSKGSCSPPLFLVGFCGQLGRGDEFRPSWVAGKFILKAGGNTSRLFYRLSRSEARPRAAVRPSPRSRRRA